MKSAYYKHFLFADSFPYSQTDGQIHTMKTCRIEVLLLEHEIRKPLLVKIAILYILQEYKTPIPDSLLVQIAIDQCSINYFTLKQCLYELASVSYIETYVEKNMELHKITEKGRQSLEYFSTKLPYVIRRNISECVSGQQKIRDKNNGFECECIAQSPQEYNIHCIYTEEHKTTFELLFRAGNKQQAQELAKRIRAKHDLFYSDIYNYIIHLSSEELPKEPATPKYEDIDEINFFGEEDK